MLTQKRRKLKWVLHCTWPGSILEIGQWGSNGPPSIILEGPLSRRRGSKKVGTKSKKPECFLRIYTFYIGRTRRTLCRHFETFWATEKAWARITAKSRKFFWWNTDSNEEEKGNWYSKRLYKNQSKFIERPSNQCCCQWCFRILYLKKKVLILGSFLRNICRGNVNSMRHFFPNCGNPARPHSRRKPCMTVVQKDRKQGEAGSIFHFLTKNWKNNFKGNIGN